MEKWRFALLNGHNIFACWKFELCYLFAYVRQHHLASLLCRYAAVFVQTVCDNAALHNFNCAHLARVDRPFSKFFFNN